MSANKRKHPARKPQPVRALAFQSDFRCSNCGLCCTTAWPIPVEAAPLDRIRRHLDAGTLVAPGGLNTVDDLFAADQAPPAGGGAWLAKNPDGACRFLERSDTGALCAIHRQVGPEALGLTCRVYPRLCVLQPRGVFVSLSCFCPAAAGLLLREDMTLEESLECLPQPPAFPADGVYSGLDARTHRPPLLRPGVALSWEAALLWERHAVQFLKRRDLTPEEALVVLATTAEKARSAPGDAAPPLAWLRRLLETDAQVDAALMRAQIAQIPGGLVHHYQSYAGIFLDTTDPTGRLAPHFALFREAWGGEDRAAAFQRFQADYDVLVRPAWTGCDVPLRRYLAARLFADCFLYQGHGLRTSLAAVATFLYVLRVHALLVCRRDRAPLDTARFLEAVALTDFLLLHTVQRDWLTRFFRKYEEGSILELLALFPA